MLTATTAALADPRIRGFLICLSMRAAFGM
jgi:hypothetical protein